MSEGTQIFSDHRSTNAEKLGFGDLKGRVAIISGATRGIGKECALALAREGCHIVVAAKTTEPTPGLPGTIYTVAQEIENLGVTALPVRMDVLDADSILDAVEQAASKFGRIDICINNASALWWQPIEDTPLKKYDLITQLNARGSFLLTKCCLPHMRKHNYGRVINMSPPIMTDYEAYKGVTAYNISKLGMSMVALGVAAEYSKDYNITGNCLWPATVIESQASINFSLGEKKTWRKATIIADATVAICCDPNKITGQTLIDDVYLLSRGLSTDDLKVYRYDPDFEPPRYLANHKPTQEGFGINRGDVKKLDDDMKKDNFEAAKVNAELKAKL